MRHVMALGLMAVLAFALGCADGDVAKKSPTKPGKRPGTARAPQNASAVRGGPTIGEEAPEIEGVDLEGVAFKLSDYRGKVVMLDFYGDW